MEYIHNYLFCLDKIKGTDYNKTEHCVPRMYVYMYTNVHGAQKTSV